MTVTAQLPRRRWAFPATVALLRLAIALLLYLAAAGVWSEATRRGDRSVPVLVVLAVTAVVATVLWAVRDRVDALARRLVYGRDAAGFGAAERLLQTLADALPVDEVALRLAEAAGRLAGRRGAEVRVRIDDGEVWSRVWPPRSSAAQAPVTVGVNYLGEAVGEIRVDVADTPRFDRRLLDELARPAGLALSTVRLTVGLRRRRDDLEQVNAELIASAQRLREVRRHEQVGMRADVEERVLSRTEAVAVAVRGGGAAVEGVPVADVLSAALDAIRSISRGIFPPNLADEGLTAALREWLMRLPSHVRAVVHDTRVDSPSPGGIPPVRYPAEVDACGFFCVVTIVRALARAGAERLDVRIDANRERLRLTVRGDALLPPDELQTIRDRAGAYGGTAELVSSTQGARTGDDEVAVQIPANPDAE